MIVNIFEWLFSSGKCVECGEKTANRLVNAHTGELDFIHDGNDTNGFGCKYAWRLRQDGEADSYDDYRSYLASNVWYAKTQWLKAAVGWRCEKCKRGGNKKTLHVHHRHYKTLYNERRKDVVVLCEYCHKAVHS